MNRLSPKKILAALRRAARPFFQPPAFVRPALVFLAAGTAVAVGVLGNLEVDPIPPVGMAGLFALDVVADAGFGIRWGRNFRPSAGVQSQAGERVLWTLAALCIAALAVLAVSLLILLASRWRARSHERAVRVACGASSRQIRRAEIAGGSVLAAMGGLMGLGVGYLAKILVALSWPQDLSASPYHVGFLPLLPVLGGILLLVPLTSALRNLPSSTRGDLGGLLSGGSRLMGTRYPEGLRGLLPAVQIGISLTLLMGSSLLLRSFYRDPETGGLPAGANAVLRVPVAQRASDGPVPAPGAEWMRFLFSLRGVEGVSAVALFTPGAWLGLGPADLTWTHCGECFVGGMWVPFKAPPVRIHVVSADSFRAMGIPLTAGREFTPVDGPGAPLVAVVNESYAGEHFDREGPLGRSIRVGRGEEGWHTVVGVVKDFGVEGVGASKTPDAAVFLSAAQHPPDRADLLLGVQGDVEAVSKKIVGLVEEEGGLVMSGVAGGVASFLAHSVAPLEWFGGLALVLGLITLGSSAFGVYSLATYSVFLRTGEIGLRRALGASGLRVAALVFRRSGAVLLLGIFLGLEGALLLAAWMQELAFNSQGFDLWLFVGASSVLAVSAALGTLVPSRRASRIPPATAMSGA